MNQILNVNYEGRPAYSIMLEPDFGKLAEAFGSLSMTNRRVMIITDDNVGAIYLEAVKNIFLSSAKAVESFVFPSGEGSKNLDTVGRCYEQLIQAGFDRKDILVALGGGVAGDLTGFVAATYLRGISFIQLPTSLLAMVDSSIGGKTGVDFKAYKNMVGAFHQPKLVYMNLSTLLTLPQAEYNSGMSEIVKHGLIKDARYYQWLKEHKEEIRRRSFDILLEMIRRSCEIKREVVERDPKELGERALLNFGHTIGHSVEKLKELSYLHGECVSLGMAAASFLSLSRGMITKEEYEDILDTMISFGQPVKVDGLSASEVYEVTRSDKKMDAQQIRFVLLQGIGNAVIDTTVTKDEMLDAIHSILEGITG
ncbi:3-dehydroquinate synthase [Anaerotaenia torta]|uniref:3-dehydroquinate synthase n=1 Tax=Anaerotaenia torta TaxID=433293 RepID=UPI003D197BC0